MWITFNDIVINKYSIFTTQSDSRCALKLKKMAYLHWLRENYPNDPLTTEQENIELENGFEDSETARRLSEDWAILSLYELGE
jgi:hypothetical protein